MPSTLIALGQLLTVAFAAGINLYATVAVLGLAARFGWIGPLPGELSALSALPVLVTAGALYIIEFVADKIPWFDTAWDAIHTFIRPPAAAALVWLGMGGATAPRWLQIVAALLAAVVAFGSHSAKAGTRISINLSPEPLSNALLSGAEDLLVGIVVAMALRYPWMTAGTTSLLLVAMAVLAPRIIRRARFGLLALYQRIHALDGTGPWVEWAMLPQSVRDAVGEPTPGYPAPRAVRAVGDRPPGDREPCRGVAVDSPGVSLCGPPAAAITARLVSPPINPYRISPRLSGGLPDASGTRST